MINEDVFKELWSSEKTVDEIAECLGISISHVGNIKRKLGLPRRKSGPKIPEDQKHYPKTEESAYLMGLAIGDGNLSRLRKGVYRLRLFCDAQYPKIIEKWRRTCESVLCRKASISTSYTTKKCKIVAVHSNRLKELPWKPNKGHKWKQKVQMPKWITENESFLCACIRGLFESDGCYYEKKSHIKTRKYVHREISFSNSSEELIAQVISFFEKYNIRFRVVERVPGKNENILRRTTNFLISTNEVDKFCELTGFTKKE